MNILLPVFENFMENAPGTADYDPVRQSIVILMGNLARHLDADNPKVKPIVAQLIAALSTPSQEVGMVNSSTTHLILQFYGTFFIIPLQYFES